MDIILYSLLSSLNQIEVRGKENIELLHGSIVLVEKLKTIVDEVMKNDSNDQKQNVPCEIRQPDDQPGRADDCVPGEQSGG